MAEAGSRENASAHGSGWPSEGASISGARSHSARLPERGRHHGRGRALLAKIPLLSSRLPAVAASAPVRKWDLEHAPSSTRGARRGALNRGLRGKAFLGIAAAVAGALAGAAGRTASATVSLVLVHAFPACAHVVGAGALWSRDRLFGVALPGGGRFGLALLRPLRASMVSLALARALMPPLAPSLWRSIRYWRRIMPIFARYLWASHRAQRLRRAGKGAEAAALWEKRHRAGAEEMHSMLNDLRGFYLKLGQIIATKTDMLGPVYTEVLGKLHDQMPYVALKQVRRLLTKELKRPSKKVFRWVDDVPLASATIGQVHKATLRGGAKVVIKVQHKGVERMMRSDLRNMRLFLEILELCRLDIGFDMLSIIREYQEVVPYEFDFAREGKMQGLLRGHLLSSGYGSDMVIPRVMPELTTRKVLVMEHLDGIPILDVRHFVNDRDKVELMTKLVRSFGMMVLRDGIFHTDPHPGNLLALYNSTTQQMAVGLLDFGQVKELSAQGQQDFAKLCLALASRDPSRVRETMAEVGLDIRGCSPEFQAAAGHILFDTRMDFPEAWMSPFDEAAVEFRKTIVKVFPQELFMIMRVMTLFRGILASLEVDVSSALLWEDLALEVVEGRAGIDAGQSEAPKKQLNGTKSKGVSKATDAGARAVEQSSREHRDQRGANKDGPKPAREPETPQATLDGVTSTWEPIQSSPGDKPSAPWGMSSVSPVDVESEATSRASSLCPSLRDMSPLSQDDTDRNLHDLRSLLLESRRGSLNGSEVQYHNPHSLEELVVAAPSLPQIRTGIEPTKAAVTHSLERIPSLDHQLKPFEDSSGATGNPAAGSLGSVDAAAPMDRVDAVKRTEANGFTFSPVRPANPFSSLAQPSGVARSYDSALAGASSTDHGSHPSMRREQNGGTVIRKQMNAGAGAPPVHYTVKLSDV